MSHQTNGNDVFSGPITIPDTLDTDYSTVTVPGALQALADRTKQMGLTLGADTTSNSMEDVTEGSVATLGADYSGAFPFSMPVSGRADYARAWLMSIASKIVGLRAITAQPYDEQVNIGAGTLSPKWQADFAASVPGVSQNDVGFAYAIVCPLIAHRTDPTLTFGTTTTPLSIRAVRARVGRLSGSAHSAVPATKRILDLCYADLYAGSPATVVVATATDSAASAATYDAFHDITLTLAPGAAVISDATKMWFVRLQGESGANATIGHGMIDLRVCYTLT
jgi:hypothetical protein